MNRHPAIIKQMMWVTLFFIVPLSEGDTICLESEIPQHWKNKGETPASLLWLKIK